MQQISNCDEKLVAYMMTSADLTDINCDTNVSHAKLRGKSRCGRYRRCCCVGWAPAKKREAHRQTTARSAFLC